MAEGQIAIDSNSSPRKYYSSELVPMKIIESRSSFELSAILEHIEVRLYQEALRTETPISIPELENKKFLIKKMIPRTGEDAQENAWHLMVQQAAPEVEP